MEAEPVTSYIKSERAMLSTESPKRLTALAASSLKYSRSPRRAEYFDEIDVMSATPLIFIKQKDTPDFDVCQALILINIK